MYAKSSLYQSITIFYKLINPNSYKVEDMWLQISKNKKKNYIVGGIYRHPCQNITDFRNMINITLCKIANQKHTCIVTGDFNIDLLQLDTQITLQKIYNVSIMTL